MLIKTQIMGSVRLRIGGTREVTEEEEELVRSGRARTDSSADLIQLHTKHRQLTITVKAERERGGRQADEGGG